MGKAGGRMLDENPHSLDLSNNESQLLWNKSGTPYLHWNLLSLEYFNTVKPR